MQFIEGYLVGLAMIVFIGPVFFLLLTCSLQYGVKLGTSVALGIIVSDIVCVLLCYYGLSPFFKHPSTQYWLSILGGIILTGMGIAYFMKNESSTSDELNLSPGHWSVFFVKGFLVNFVNPFVFMVWIGVIAYAESKWGKSTDSFIYLCGVLSGIFSLDMSKVFLARQIQSYIRPQTLGWIYRIAGLAMVILGLRLFILLF